MATSTTTLNMGGPSFTQFVRNSLVRQSGFLTGTEDADFAAEINNNFGRTEDLHGTRNSVQMYNVFWKKQISLCIKNIAEFSAESSIGPGRCAGESGHA